MWGSNPGGGEIFRTCPDRPWCPPSLLYNGYLFFPGGKGRPGRDADPSSPSSAVVIERVKLYLYSPCGPYGLYRASVPLPGCILPFFVLPIHHYECWRSLSRTKLVIVDSNSRRVVDVCALIYLVTAWSGVLLEKLTGFPLVKKLPAFYGTRRFITAVTSARHLSLS